MPYSSNRPYDTKQALKAAYSASFNWGYVAEQFCIYRNLIYVGTVIMSEYMTDYEYYAGKLADTIDTENGWDTVLRVMAEHPNFSLYNVMRVCEYRFDHPNVKDTRVLLPWQQVHKLGGKILSTEQPADRSIVFDDVTQHAFDRVNGNALGGVYLLYTLDQCTGLNIDFSGYNMPWICNQLDSNSSNIFADARHSASNAVGIFGDTPDGRLGSIVGEVLARRYKLHGPAEDENSVLPPKYSDIKDMMGQFDRVQSYLSRYCRVMDCCLDESMKKAHNIKLDSKNEESLIKNYKVADAHHAMDDYISYYSTDPSFTLYDYLDRYKKLPPSFPLPSDMDYEDALEQCL